MTPELQRQTELSVIGVCLHYPDARLLAAEQLSGQDFTDPVFRKCFELCTTSPDLTPFDLAKTGIDPGLLSSLASDYYGTIESLQRFAAAMQDATRMRMLRELCNTVLHDELEPDEAIGLIMSKSEAMMRRSGSNAVRFADALDEAGALMASAKARRAAGGVLGLEFGLPAVDHCLGGITGPRLVILAAHTGCGKTTMLNQLAMRNAVRNALPGLIFSLEMGRDELVIRSMALASGVNMARLMRGTATDEESAKAVDSIVRCGDFPLWIDTETYSLDKIIAQATVMHARHRLGFVAVDHIGLVTGGQRESRNDWIGNVTRSLKQLAKRLNVPVIALCQFNRGSAKEDRRPSLHDLRDSGNIEQDADIVMMIHTSEEERTKPQRQVQIGFPKNRIGPAVWLNEQFMLDAAVQRFVQTVDSAHG